MFSRTRCLLQSFNNGCCPHLRSDKTGSKAHHDMTSVYACLVLQKFKFAMCYTLINKNCRCFANSEQRIARVNSSGGNSL